MLHLYGLKNCDKCRKALGFARAKGLEHSFHDLREEGLAADKLDQWVALAGWESLLNRKSTTWRGLEESERQDLDDAKAKDLMLRNPTLVKRPVIEYPGGLQIGFDQVAGERLLAVK